MKTAWVLTEGMMGTQNQCVALARAAGLNPEIKTVKLRNPWKAVTPWLPCFSPAALVVGSSELVAPWPDVVIASGRKAIAPGLWIKKQSGGRTKLVIVQSPVIKDKNFDLVVVPHHDMYKAANAIQIMGALSNITPDDLVLAKEEWRTVFEKLPQPRVAVLIGGNSRTHRMTDEVTMQLAAQLAALAGKGGALMVTCSRRTPPEQQQMLQQALQGCANVYFYDGQGANPYRGMLAWADRLIVSEDSVSMACEAASTGKPVYIVRMEGGSKRFRRFHDLLIGKGCARWFAGEVAPFSYAPPDDLGMAAAAVKKLLNN